MKIKVHRVSVASVVREKVSWQPRAKKAPKSHCVTKLTQEMYWEGHKRLAVSVLDRSGKGLSRRQALPWGWQGHFFQSGLGLVELCGPILDVCPVG